MASTSALRHVLWMLALGASCRSPSEDTGAVDDTGTSGRDSSRDTDTGAAGSHTGDTSETPDADYRVVLAGYVITQDSWDVDWSTDLDLACVDISAERMYTEEEGQAMLDEYLGDVALDDLIDFSTQEGVLLFNAFCLYGTRLEVEAAAEDGSGGLDLSIAVTPPCEYPEIFSRSYLVLALTAGTYAEIGVSATQTDCETF